MSDLANTPSNTSNLITTISEIITNEGLAALWNGEEITRESRLREDLDVESIDHIDLVFGLEQSPEIGLKRQIPMSDAQTWKTVGEICDWIEANRA